MTGNAVASGWRLTRGASGSGRDGAVAAGLGVWLVVGLFADGWAHHTVPGLESFFTPWHAALYAGFAASAGWVGWLAARSWRHSRARDVPAAYAIGLLGVVVFGLGGVGDMAWHLAFGVEDGLEALLSPTHLVLLTGGFLLLGTPLWQLMSDPGARSGELPASRRLPALVSLTTATAVIAFFLLYASVFTSTAVTTAYVQLPENAPDHGGAELPAVAGLGAYLVTTAVLALPLLWWLGRQPARFGTASILVPAVAWLSVAVEDFRPSLVAGAVAATVAAVVADLAWVALDARRGTGAVGRLPIAGGVLALLLWPSQLAGFATIATVRWPVELWAGVLTLTVLEAALLGVLLSSAAGPRRAPAQAQ